MSITELKIYGGMGNGSGNSCLSVVDDQEKGCFNMVLIKDEDGNNNDNNNKGCFLNSSSSCSSIGNNSDDCDGGEDEDEEVQSCYKCENGSFDSIQALEEALPLRQGMSRFYNGKSKSFTSLADASTYSSINDIVKPENPYSKRRRNLLACNLVVSKNKSFRLKSSGGVAKRSNSQRSTLALAVAMAHSPELRENPNSKPTSTPQYSNIRQTNFSSSPSKFSPWRSYSFADLEHCASLKASAPL